MAKRPVAAAVDERESPVCDSALERWQRQDLDDLAALFAGKDGRSLEEMIADEPRSEYTIDTAKRYDGNQWEVRFDDGLTTLLEMPEGRGINPGDKLGLFCGGRSAFGSMRHGFEINGEVIAYKTPWERYAARIAMHAAHDRDDRERAAIARKDVAEWVTQLRGPYLARVQRFIACDPTFVIRSGTYETYPVLMAQRVEEWVRERHPDAKPRDWDEAVALVKELEALKYEHQVPVLHGSEGDRYGVSGHQVDSAFAMAAQVLSGGGI